jgi:hypothetical protein
VDGDRLGGMDVFDLPYDCKNLSTFLHAAGMGITMIGPYGELFGPLTACDKPSLLVYFDRMSELFEDAAGRPFVINSFNVHRLIIAEYTVASKVSNGVFYENFRYSKVRKPCNVIH